MSCRLLVAEDEKYLREKVTKNIDWQNHDFIIYEASDGEEALAIIKTEDIDILVTDIRMPRMDGIELARQAKDFKQELRVIVISGYAEFELAQASIRLGVDDYILKPFRSQRLFEVVSTARQRIKMERLDPNVQGLQNTIAKHFLGDHEQSVFQWLVSPEFFIKQSQASNCCRLKEVLKSGTVDELNEEVKLLLADLERNYANKEEVFILLNTFVAESLEAIEEMGFTLEQGIQLMRKHLPHKTEGRFEDLKPWIQNFLLDINVMINSGQHQGTEQLITEIKSYVDQNYRSGVSLSTLAEHINVSTGYLSKLFREHVGEHFSDYVNNLKSQKAKELLKTTDNKIYEIADYLGFNDAYYFSSWFKRNIGCSPTEYRANLTFKDQI